MFILMLVLAILSVLLWIGFKITGALLAACIWLFIKVPVALVLGIVGIALCCTLIFIPIGKRLVKAALKLIF